MSSEDILIIGAGPSSVTFAQHLVAEKIKPAIITPGDLNFESFTGKLNLENINSPWKFSPPVGSNGYSETKNNFFTYSFYGPGGLSNSWGAGCSKLTKEDLGVTDRFLKNLYPYYEMCEEKIGITSRGNDLLDSYLGTFRNTGDKANLNPRFMFPYLSNETITLGYTRQAITTTDKSEFRKACRDCGSTFIHCSNGSVYNSANVLKEIKNDINLISNAYVTKIKKIENKFLVTYISNGTEREVKAKKIILGAGPIESAKLIYTLLNSENKIKNSLELKLNHNPMTRLFFISTTKSKKNKYNAGQMVGRINFSNNKNFYLSLVDGNSVPTSDIIMNFPIKNKFFYNLFDILKKYLVFGFIFFPSEYSDVTMQIDNNQYLYKEKEKYKIKNLVLYSRKKLRKFFLKNNLFLMPKILSNMTPGSDLHLGSTFPIGDKDFLNVNENCELNGMPNIFIIDGSWMPKIPEKPHTFTLMSNAMRIADYISKQHKVNEN